MGQLRLADAESAGDVRSLKGVGPKLARLLEEKLGIRTVEDLMRFAPRDYYDRSRVTPIAALQTGVPAVIEGEVASIRGDWVGRGRFHVTRAKVEDASGAVTLLWYNQSFMARALSAGDRIIVWGTPDNARGFHFNPREYEKVDTDGPAVHFGGWIPIYRLPSDISTRVLRRIVRSAVEGCDVPDLLPEAVRERRGLAPLRQALRDIHFPENLKAYEAARTRLAYDELFFLQTAVALLRAHVKQQQASFALPVSRALNLRIRARFPFALTGAQERVIEELRKDLATGRPMNRLLQGDVGSGKTIVAAYAVLAAVGRRTQACIMAPTEVLAAQHYATFSRLLQDSRVRIHLLAAGTKPAPDRFRKIDADLVIGTHALLEDPVRFEALSLVVIDEQHKFGVAQRAKLVGKGRAPHVLVMTATPIPRTLALTVFGDLDVSVIDELPPGRRPPRTFFRPRDKFPAILEFIRRLLRDGRQAYFVYPAIEDSSKMTNLKAATTMFEKLKRELPDFHVGLLHGRLDSAEKARVMGGFTSGAVHVLVSTVVVEVGIDVPNAGVMVIDNAERFGLSQLHQLRGRIGRGGDDAYCILLGEPTTDEAKRRIDAMLATTDGFKIAEKDLEIRGPGEFLGTRQSGDPELRVANLIADVKLLGQARSDAFELVRSGLSPKLLDAVRARYESRLAYIQAR